MRLHRRLKQTLLMSALILCYISIQISWTIIYYNLLCYKHNKTSKVERSQLVDYMVFLKHFACNIHKYQSSEKLMNKFQFTHFPW